MNYRQIRTLKASQTKTSKIVQTPSKEEIFLKIYHSPPLNELAVYKRLQQPHLHGFPTLIDSAQRDNSTYLFFQSLGQNLQTLRRQCHNSFSLKTVLMVALQIIDRIQYLHSLGFIHGDIKPSNILTGKNKLKHKIFLADFDLSQQYATHGKHVNQTTVDSFNGSLRFCTKRVKSSLSRRDDIESLYYSIIYLLKGDLPWMHLNSSTITDAYTETSLLKHNTLPRLLEELPPFFTLLFDSLDRMEYPTQPQYQEIRNVLQAQMKKNGYQLDYRYDWDYL